MTLVNSLLKFTLHNLVKYWSVYIAKLLSFILICKEGYNLILKVVFRFFRIFWFQVGQAGKVGQVGKVGKVGKEDQEGHVR